MSQAPHVWAVQRSTTDKASGQLLAPAGNTASACRSRLNCYRLLTGWQVSMPIPLRSAARCAPPRPDRTFAFPDAWFDVLVSVTVLRLLRDAGARFGGDAWRDTSHIKRPT